MDNDKILATFYAYDYDDVSLYSHALGYKCALNEIFEFIRSKAKYGNDYKTVAEALEKIKEELYDIKSRYDLPEDV